MIFEALSEAAARGELLLMDCGMCHFHRRRDGIVTIREIIVLPYRRRWGIGRYLVERAGAGANTVQARCPADLTDANAFWAALGFKLAGQESARSGRTINLWRKEFDSSGVREATVAALPLPSAPDGGTDSAPTPTTTPLPLAP